MPLPTKEGMFADAEEQLETIYRLLGKVRDTLNSDWEPAGNLSMAQADRRSMMFTEIAKAKAAVERAKSRPEVVKTSMTPEKAKSELVGLQSTLDMLSDNPDDDPEAEFWNAIVDYQRDLKAYLAGGPEPDRTELTQIQEMRSLR